MFNSRTVRERYLNDAHFHTLVDMMVSHIDACNYAPSEMREAAVLASIIYQEQNISRTMLVNPEVEDASKILHKWVDYDNGFHIG